MRNIGMLSIPIGPLRESDLIHTWNALRAHGERILGFTQLSADRVTSTSFGLVIDQSGSARKWTPSGPRIACHLLDLVELEEFGIHALLNQQIDTVAAGNFIALCPAYRLSEAAQHLRVQHIGPRLYIYTAATRHAEIAAAALQIPTRPANDNRLPSVVELRYARQFQFDLTSAEVATQHFNLPASINGAEPVVVDLGAESILAVARSEQS
jgi:hypothetical protein